MNQEWIISPPWSQREQAASRWNVPPLIAQILANRGIDSDEAPAGFLAPQLSALHRPDLLPGAPEAANIISDAMQRGERIVIYGDYDVDGMTGVAILWNLLKIAGHESEFYVPHRLEEGYGINCDAIRSLAADGAKTIVSVDCGITAVESAIVANELGIKLIITDHHQPGPTLPNCAAIVHPTVGGTYPNEHLSGAGVAFKLAWAVAQSICGTERVTDLYREYLHQALAFAALGTIADVVPLMGENRVIARHGLHLLRETPFIGLRALIDSVGLNGQRVNGYDVGFKIAPRLNAAGRMGHARLGVELLTRANEARAREIALYLHDQNRSRQTTERRISRQAAEMVKKNKLDSDACRAIVLATADWHPGVIGIVAARLVDRYHRPTALIALQDDVGQASARSIPNFDFVAALGECSEHLIEFGGHRMAAGFKINADQIPAFTEKFTALANNRLTASDLRPKLRIDAEVPLSELDLETAELLSELGPFGIGNPQPVFSTDWVELADEPRCVGKSGTHLQAVFSDGRAVLKAIAFGKSESLDDLKRHRRCKVAFEPLINDFNGRRNVEMRVRGFQFPPS